MKMKGEWLENLPELVINAVLGLLVLALAAMTGYSAAPQFQLRDTEGVLHTNAEWSGSKAIVLFFVTNDCPVSNSYVPEMNRIRDAYAARGVRFYAVEADPGLPASAVAGHARDYRFDFPVLADPQQVLVQLADATVTPQAVILSPEGKVLYRGRIDNRVEDFGRKRPEATVHDLTDALEAVLAGRPVAVPFTKSIGCAIPRRRG